MVKPSDTITHLFTVFLFYMLIVSTFATCHAFMLWSSMCNRKIFDSYIFGVHDIFYKTIQQGFRLIIPNTLQRNWKLAKTINCNKYNHTAPPVTSHLQLSHFVIPDTLCNKVCQTF